MAASASRFCDVAHMLTQDCAAWVVIGAITKAVKITANRPLKNQRYLLSACFKQKRSALVTCHIKCREKKDRLRIWARCNALNCGR